MTAKYLSGKDDFLTRHKEVEPDEPRQILGVIPYGPLWSKTMEIKRNGSRPSSKGPEDWFTGTVRIDPLFQADRARPRRRRERHL